MKKQAKSRVQEVRARILEICSEINGPEEHFKNEESNEIYIKAIKEKYGKELEYLQEELKTYVQANLIKGGEVKRKQLGPVTLEPMPGKRIKRGQLLWT
jgi:hypothetical protein